MAKFKDQAGLKTGAKSPSAIENAEHLDKAGAKKVVNCVPGSLDAILPNSNTEIAVKPKSVVRFMNTAGVTAFVWCGIEGTAPVTVDITNGYAVGAGQELIVAFAEPEDQTKSAAFKTSAATVQAALIES